LSYGFVPAMLMPAVARRGSRNDAFREGIDMKPDEFQLFFAVVQKSGETVRSAFYVFVLIYGAMLFYAANTYLYPTGQHLFASVQDAITKAAGCGGSEAGTPCLGPLAPTSTIEKINTDYSTHLLEYYQDKSAADREFHVPFVGIAPDRGWFWLINIVSSLLLYVMLRGSLENHLHLLEYLFNETKGNTAQVMLLTTTQIVTSASRSRESGTSQGNLLFSAEYLSAFTLLLMPIAVSCFILFDWAYLMFTADSPIDVIRQPALTLGFVLTIFTLLWQARMFRGIAAAVYLLFVSDRARQMEVRGAEPEPETRAGQA
jgi:hypothetical protein